MWPRQRAGDDDVEDAVSIGFDSSTGVPALRVKVVAEDVPAFAEEGLRDNRLVGINQVRRLEL